MYSIIYMYYLLYKILIINVFSNIYVLFVDVTLSALNAPESDIDIEGDSSSSKKLEFDSGIYQDQMTKQKNPEEFMGS